MHCTGINLNNLVVALGIWRSNGQQLLWRAGCLEKFSVAASSKPSEIYHCSFPSSTFKLQFVQLIWWMTGWKVILLRNLFTKKHWEDIFIVRFLFRISSDSQSDSHHILIRFSSGSVAFWHKSNFILTYVIRQIIK